MELLKVKDFIRYCKPVKGCYYNLDESKRKELQKKYTYLKENKDRKVNYIEPIHKFSTSKDYISLYENCDLLTSMIIRKEETIEVLERILNK